MHKCRVLELKYYLRKVSGISLISVVAVAGAIGIFLHNSGIVLPSAPYWVKALYSIFDGFSFADKSKIGYIAVIYYGISALTYPLAAAYVFGFLMYEKNDRSEWSRKPFTKRQRIWVLPIAIVLVVFSLLGLSSFHGQNSRYLRIEESVQSMVLQGWIAFVGCGLILGVAVALIWKFLLTSKEYR